MLVGEVVRELVAELLERCWLERAGWGSSGWGGAGWGSAGWDIKYIVSGGKFWKGGKGRK